MSPKEPDPIFRTSLYFPPTMNSALEPLLLAILRDQNGGWGQAPTPLRGGQRPLRSSPEQGCGGGRQETENVGFWRHRAPESAKRNLITAGQSDFVVLDFFFFFGQAAVCEGFSVFPGWATWFCAAAAATLSRRPRGLEKGRGELGR